MNPESSDLRQLKLKQTPLISVIVPVYNVIGYLARCIESILSQTYTNLEIILVDDGSSDGSESECDAWKATDPRIKVIHKKNGGLSSARNAGIDVATGDYLGFIDSDDYIELDMYETLLSAILASKKEIACCGMVLEYPTFIKRINILDSPIEYNKEESFRNALLGHNIGLSACCKLYNRSLFSEIRFPFGKLSEDMPVLFQLMDKANGLICTGLPSYHYVTRAGSISKSEYSHRKYDAFEFALEIREHVQKTYPHLDKESGYFCHRIASSLLQVLVLMRDKDELILCDYREYMGCMRETALSFLRSKEIPWKEKMYTLTLLTHTYGLLKRVISLRGDRRQ